MAGKPGSKAGNIPGGWYELPAMEHGKRSWDMSSVLAGAAGGREVTIPTPATTKTAIFVFLNEKCKLHPKALHKPCTFEIL